MIWLLATIPLMVLASVIAIGPLFFQMLAERSSGASGRFEPWRPATAASGREGAALAPSAKTRL